MSALKLADQTNAGRVSGKSTLPAILGRLAPPFHCGCIISHFSLIERMTNFQRLATVRTGFLHWLQDAAQASSDSGPDGSLIHRESMLIHDEFFCGRKFHAQHYTAVWFIEEDVLKVHRADGSLELVLRGSEIDVLAAEQCDVDAGHNTTAAVVQLNEPPASDGAITEADPTDVSGTAESEPRILKLTPAHKDGVESAEIAAQVSSKVQQPSEQRTDEMESGDQQVRKAA